MCRLQGSYSRHSLLCLHYCTSERDTKQGTGTSNIHSRRLSVLHFDDPISIIRLEEDLRLAKRILLGANYASVTEANTKLSAQLANAIGTSCLPMHKTLEGKAVFPSVFDSYFGTAMWPDDLFTGLIKNVLLVCFENLGTDDDLHAIDQLICNFLYNSGLPYVDTLFVWSRGRFTALQTLSISGLSVSYSSHHIQNIRHFFKTFQLKNK